MEKRKTILIIGFLISLTSCGHGEIDWGEVIDGPKEAEHLFSDVELCQTYQVKNEEVSSGGLETAMDAWDEASGIDIFSYDTGEGLIDVKEVDYLNGDNAGETYRYHGCYCLINVLKKYALNVAVYMHEIGHCLGFDHSDFEKSIMEGNGLTSAERITSGLLELLRERY